MANTTNYNLYVTDDPTVTFKTWREEMNATTNSNMTKIDSALAGISSDVSDLDTAVDTLETALSGKSATNYIYSGTCDTAGATQTKTITIPGITALTTGLSIRIKFTNAQSYGGAPRLDVNSLGAVTVYTRGGSSSVQYAWLAGEVVDFYYDGTYWVQVDGGIASTTYYGVTKLSSSTSSTSTSLAATPSAVKSAYDLANTANNAVAGKQNQIVEYASLVFDKDDWIEDSDGYYSQTITATGLLDTYSVSPHVSCILTSSDKDADYATLQSFSKINIFETGSGTLTAKCIKSAPAVDVPVKVVVFP